MKISGVVFDKDGTLFDFNATWGAWAEKMLLAETQGDRLLLDQLADRLGYDVSNRRFVPGSIVIAETVDVVADEILKVLPDVDKSSLVARMNHAATDVPQVEATPLVEFVTALRAMDMKIGVCTNDAEAPARAHLARSGVEQVFDFIAGSDSGFGGKPAPGQLLAFCEATSLAPENCLMVGDSTHDLHAGRAAGMVCVGVLTGPAERAELEPHANVVLDSIADLPSWISTMRA